MIKTHEEKLDDIMEDLITGHNWNYARKALLEWCAEAQWEAGVQELEMARKQRIYQGISANPKYAVSDEYLVDSITQLQHKQKGDQNA